MASPKRTSPPKKITQQSEKNSTFFRHVLHFLRAIDTCLHKHRTWDEIWIVLKNYWIIRWPHALGRGIKNILTKKRTLRGTWRGLIEGVKGFFTETVAESRPPRNWFEKHQYILWDTLMMIGVYLFLFSGLKMEWFLRDIIPIGGDVPYHVANYFDLKEILLPHFQISGWSDASFGGFQLFQSYPIFPFLLIYFFDLFMGSGVAFKTVLILGAI